MQWPVHRASGAFQHLMARTPDNRIVQMALGQLGNHPRSAAFTMKELQALFITARDDVPPQTGE